MLHCSYGDINTHLLYINNVKGSPSKCIKRYPRNFLKKQSILVNCYLVY